MRRGQTKKFKKFVPTKFGDLFVLMLWTSCCGLKNTPSESWLEVTGGIQASNQSFPELLEQPEHAIHLDCPGDGHSTANSLTFPTFTLKGYQRKTTNMVISSHFIISEVYNQKSIHLSWAIWATNIFPECHGKLEGPMTCFHINPRTASYNLGYDHLC